MSLSSILNVGVLALQSQATKISGISDNIANVNTVGYKGVSTSFEDLVAGTTSATYSYASQGVLAKGQYTNDKQGDLAPSDSNTDIAISGNGFFVVSPSADSDTTYYTRAGSFSPDPDGNLINGAGYYLKAYQLDSSGNLQAGTALTAVNTQDLISTPQATTTFALSANLNSAQAAYNPNTNVNVAATGSLNFTANPSPGDTISINGHAWTFVASGAGADQTNIGADLTTTLAQLTTDLNASTNANISAATYTSDATSLTATYGSKGLGGTQFPLTSNNANVSPSTTDVGGMSFTANPSPGDTITLNGSTWTFVASGATGNQTNIGADLSSTLAQLTTDLNASTDTNIAAATYSATSPTLNITLDAPGTAFAMAANTAASTSVSANLALPPVVYDPTNPLANMAGGVVTPQFTRPVTIIDNSGVSHTVNLGFLKTANNTWQVEIYSSPASDTTSRADGQVASGTLTFNGDGSLASISGGIASAVSFPWASVGTTPPDTSIPTSANSVAFDWGTPGTTFGPAGSTVGMTQQSMAYAVNGQTQDGSSASTLKEVDISNDGIIKAVYNDGVERNLYQIPLATFYNPNALTSLSGNVFALSNDSGFIGYENADSGGAGSISANNLESSNVDLSDELTEIIIAQRAYQSDTKLVTVSDEMMQTLNSMGAT